MESTEPIDVLAPPKICPLCHMGVMRIVRGRTETHETYAENRHRIEATYVMFCPSCLHEEKHRQVILDDILTEDEQNDGE